MALRFRKRIKIAPGLHVNLGKRGASVSVGGRGATLNIGKKGVHSTVGIPGTGISYTSKHIGGSSESGGGAQLSSEVANTSLERKVSLWLAVGILFMPYIFSWFTLRSGYSNMARLVAFGWLIFVLVLINSK
jgi:hypothetical protein